MKRSSCSGDHSGAYLTVAAVEPAAEPAVVPVAAAGRHGLVLVPERTGDSAGDGQWPGKGGRRTVDE